jgi:hypothetical protein
LPADVEDAAIPAIDKFGYVSVLAHELELRRHPASSEKLIIDNILRPVLGRRLDAQSKIAPPLELHRRRSNQQAAIPHAPQRVGSPGAE